ncbi:hypothetical protein HYX70_00245 [Candidatus Saccharibacteria bacterium]|nr:hypothetical protein [Candidatus Saccharibacteria bacterium]
MPKTTKTADQLGATLRRDFAAGFVSLAQTAAEFALQNKVGIDDIIAAFLIRCNENDVGLLYKSVHFYGYKFDPITVTPENVRTYQRAIVKSAFWYACRGDLPVAR